MNNADKLIHIARQRIDLIIDAGSFIEIGALIRSNGAGVLTGYGTVSGKLVYVYSQDSTVDGGAVNIANSNKICNIMDMAIKMGAPLIQVFDSLELNYQRD